MQSVKKLPFIFLTLLAGCTEQSSDIPRVAGPVDQPEIGNQLYKVVKIVDGDTIDVLTEDKKTIRFGRRWKQWARRLGILDTSNVTVLADGAKWIWEEQQNHLRGASGVLDVFHAIEHLSETSRDVFGAGTDEASEWLDEGRGILIAEGWAGISEWIVTTRRQVRSPQKRDSLDGLYNYLKFHAEHLNYADRLTDGRSIGSGQIEGACKNLIGRRLKQTGARWRVRRVNRMAGLCALMYSEQWNQYWNTLAT